MKKPDYYTPLWEAMLANHLIRFKRMLKKAGKLPEPRQDFNEQEWFFSNVEVADFANCSTRTIRRLRKQGKLPCIRHKNVCLFRIAEVLNLIAKDDRLSKLFIRKPLPRRPPKAPVARYNSFIRKGWLWINVRFLKWNGTIVIKQRHWNSDERIAQLVKDVISYRLSKNFKPKGDEKN